MDHVEEGKPTSNDMKLVTHRKPTLVTVGSGRGERQVCTTGLFHVSVAADYALVRRDKWITIDELARLFYGSTSERNRERVRRGLHKLTRELLERHRSILLYEVKDRCVSAVKVFNPESEYDRQTVVTKLDTMLKRSLLSQHQYELATSVLTAETEARKDAEFALQPAV